MATGKDKAFSRVWLVWQESPTYRKLPARTLRVLTALAQFQEGSCLPTRVTVSYRRLCEMTGLDKPDVSRAVRALADAGFVRKLWTSSKGTCYELRCPDCMPAGVGEYDNPVGVHDFPGVGHCDNLGVGVDHNCAVGDAHHPIKNPLINESNSSNQQRMRATVDSDGFTRLWRSWPNHNGSRSQAYEIYARLVDAGIDPLVLASIADEYKQEFYADPRYYPKLARWLNPDDIGGWCEPYMERQARKRSEILDHATKDDLQDALERIDARFHDLRQHACEDPRGLVNDYQDNQSVAESYYSQHWKEARDEFAREPLKAAGFVDVALLPAFDEYCS